MPPPVVSPVISNTMVVLSLKYSLIMDKTLKPCAYRIFDMTLFKVLAYAKGFKRQAIWASICSVVNKLFDIAPEILIGIAIDVVIRQEDSFVAQDRKSTRLNSSHVKISY